MENVRVYAVPQRDGMTIYANAKGFGKVFVMHHRHNGDLFRFLSNGRDISRLKTYKPSRSRREQMLRRVLDHVVVMVEYSMRYEAAA